MNGGRNADGLHCTFAESTIFNYVYGFCVRSLLFSFLQFNELHNLLISFCSFDSSELATLSVLALGTRFVSTTE